MSSPDSSTATNKGTQATNKASTGSTSQTVQKATNTGPATTPGGLEPTTWVSDSDTSMLDLSDPYFGTTIPGVPTTATTPPPLGSGTGGTAGGPQKDGGTQRTQTKTQTTPPTGTQGQPPPSGTGTPPSAGQQQPNYFQQQFPYYYSTVSGFSQQTYNDILYSTSKGDTILRVNLGLMLCLLLSIAVGWIKYRRDILRFTGRNQGRQLLGGVPRESLSGRDSGGEGKKAQ